MRIHLLTPGTGHFYCGSCLRDNTLARALRALGHDAVTAPLYLPLVLEDPSPEETVEGEQVHMGGINMYLQQKLHLALPRFLANKLDRPGLLRWAARRGNMTEAANLGPMTLSMLQGEHGRQKHEVRKLVDWMREQERPDVIVLSNIMLIGTVRQLKRALDIPVVVTLQGESPFLDALAPAFAERAWNELRDRAAEVDAFIPVSTWYGDLMHERLGIPRAKLHVVANGIDTSQFIRPDAQTGRPSLVLGYLARMCKDKGLHTLVDAFLRLKDSARVPDLKLRVAGVLLREDQPYVDALRQRIAEHGHEHDVEFQPNLDLNAKLAFLRSLSVFSVPATYGESFGLYLLEAMASGVPVVQPRHAAFPEIIAKTGGELCEPDDPDSLADALEGLLLDDRRRDELAATGRRAVFEHFSAERMARDVEQICRILTS